MKRQPIVASIVFFALLGGTAAHAASTGAFQPAGAMTTARLNPTATLLNNGSVLVVGAGHGSVPHLPLTDIWTVPKEKAEQFDPQANTFGAAGPMVYPRANHAAVRLQDGRVLVVGGSSDIDAPYVYYFDVINGPQLTFLIATAEVYHPLTGVFDPEARQFTTAGDLITPRLNPTATLLPDDRVLVAGGRFQDTVETAELFDPTTGQFTLAGPMNLGRNQHAAVALPDGRVALLGGYHREDGPQRSVEIYDPKTNTFSAAGQMAEARADFQAIPLPDGRILVTGGIGGPPDANGLGTTVLSSVEIYNPVTGQSVVTDHLADARFGHGAVALADGRVLVMGGNAALDGSLPLSTVALIDPGTGKVTPAASMTSPRGRAVPALLPDGRVLVVGSQSGTTSAEVYVP